MLAGKTVSELEKIFRDNLMAWIKRKENILLNHLKMTTDCVHPWIELNHTVVDVLMVNWWMFESEFLFIWWI